METYKSSAIAYLDQQIEEEIRAVNREILSAELGKVSLKRLHNAIAFVAELRSRYLAAVLELSDPAALEKSHTVISEFVERLERDRRAFEESLAGLKALRHALSQGYVDTDADVQADTEGGG